MMKLLVVLVVLAGSYAWYSNFQEKKAQTELLRKQVAALEVQNAELAKREKTVEQKVASVSNGQQSRLADLNLKLNAETVKLQAFQQRRSLMTAALADPAQATSLAEVDSEIKEKNEAIQSLQLQLSTNQNAEKDVDHNGEAARQNTNLTRAQAMADINARIRGQEELIRTTQANIRAMRVAGDVNGGANLQAANIALQQQRADLQTLKASKDQVNQAVAAQNVQIHQQVGYEKGSIRSNEQEIRNQISGLKSEVSALQSQKSGSTRSKAEVQKQASYLDQQIAAEKTEIQRIQGLISAEQR